MRRTWYLCDGTGPDMAFFNGHKWNKVVKIVELVREIKRNNEKVVIFSGLRPMVSAISKALAEERISFIPIVASNKSAQRFDLIQKFSRDDGIFL
jgi:SNF2 family DNA or RNA helicase